MANETHGDAVSALTPSVSAGFFRTVVVLIPVAMLTWAGIVFGFYLLVA
jgi:hypothetical protein